MPTSPIRLSVTRHFDAPSEQVFDAWLDSANAGRWLFATDTGVMQRVELDPKVGGHFIIAEQRGDVLAEHFGTYLLLDRPRRLVFSFTVDVKEPPSKISIDIEPDGTGCLLTLTHEIDAKWADYVEKTKAGWTKILDGLASQI